MTQKAKCRGIKARLVAKGFLQTPGVDFGETFSHVIKASTLQVILRLAVSKDWQIRQADVNNAFLNSKSNEMVYMNQLRGFVDQKNPSFMRKLEKALYRLRQAARALHEKLKNTLLKWNFKQSKANNSLFFLANGRDALFALVYVDYIVITGNDNQQLQEFINKLNTCFSLKDMGSLSQFLGIEVHRDTTGLYLTQTKYAIDLRNLAMRN